LEEEGLTSHRKQRLAALFAHATSDIWRAGNPPLPLQSQRFDDSRKRLYAFSPHFHFEQTETIDSRSRTVLNMDSTEIPVF
jgi:hypothetical protein